MRRRTFVAAMTGAVGTAGCLGFVTGDETYEQEASPAQVDDAILDDTGYSLDEAYPDAIDREFEVAGRSRTVRATNQVARYHRGIDLPLLGTAEAAVFAVVATPAFEIAGQTLNPVGEMDNADLAEMVQDEYEELAVDDQIATSSVDTLGEEMALSQFEGTATFGGTDLDIYVHVGTVRSGGDFAVAVGVHPRQFFDESAVVRELVAGLVHDT